MKDRMEREDSLRKTILMQLAFTMFCAAFGAIYEIFSHEVYSYYMIYAFAIPLVLGVTLPLLMEQRGGKQPRKFSLRMWNYGIVTITVGCIYKGVLEIFGTTNRLIWVYVIAGAIMISLGVLTYTLQGSNKVCKNGI